MTTIDVDDNNVVGEAHFVLIWSYKVICSVKL